MAEPVDESAKAAAAEEEAMLRLIQAFQSDNWPAVDEFLLQRQITKLQFVSCSLLHAHTYPVPSSHQHIENECHLFRQHMSTLPCRWRPVVMSIAYGALTILTQLYPFYEFSVDDNHLCLLLYCVVGRLLTETTALKLVHFLRTHMRPEEFLQLLHVEDITGMLPLELAVTFGCYEIAQNLLDVPNYLLVYREVQGVFHCKVYNISAYSVRHPTHRLRQSPLYALTNVREEQYEQLLQSGILHHPLVQAWLTQQWNHNWMFVLFNASLLCLMMVLLMMCRLPNLYTRIYKTLATLTQNSSQQQQQQQEHSNVGLLICSAETHQNQWEPYFHQEQFLPGFVVTNVIMLYFMLWTVTSMRSYLQQYFSLRQLERSYPWLHFFYLARHYWRKPASLVFESDVLHLWLVLLLLGLDVCDLVIWLCPLSTGQWLWMLSVVDLLVVAQLFCLVLECIVLASLVPYVSQSSLNLIKCINVFLNQIYLHILPLVMFSYALLLVLPCWTFRPVVMQSYALTSWMVVLRMALNFDDVDTGLFDRVWVLYTLVVCLVGMGLINFVIAMMSESVAQHAKYQRMLTQTHWIHVLHTYELYFGRLWRRLGGPSTEWIVTVYDVNR